MIKSDKIGHKKCMLVYVPYLKNYIHLYMFLAIGKRVSIISDNSAGGEGTRYVILSGQRIIDTGNTCGGGTAS